MKPMSLQLAYSEGVMTAFGWCGKFLIFPYLSLLAYNEYGRSSSPVTFTVQLNKGTDMVIPTLRD